MGILKDKLNKLIGKKNPINSIPAVLGDLLGDIVDSVENGGGGDKPFIIYPFSEHVLSSLPVEIKQKILNINITTYNAILSHIEKYTQDIFTPPPIIYQCIDTLYLPLYWSMERKEDGSFIIFQPITSYSQTLNKVDFVVFRCKLTPEGYFENAFE